MGADEPFAGAESKIELRVTSSALSTMEKGLE